MTDYLVNKCVYDNGAMEVRIMREDISSASYLQIVAFGAGDHRMDLSIRVNDGDHELLLANIKAALDEGVRLKHEAAALRARMLNYG